MGHIAETHCINKYLPSKVHCTLFCFCLTSSAFSEYRVQFLPLINYVSKMSSTKPHSQTSIQYKLNVLIFGAS